MDFCLLLKSQGHNCLRLKSQGHKNGKREEIDFLHTFEQSFSYTLEIKQEEFGIAVHVSLINSFNPVPDKLSGATKLPSARTPDKLSGVLATFVLASFCFNGMHI